MRVGEILAMERAQVTQNRQFYLPLMGGLALLTWIAAVATTYNAELGGLIDFIQGIAGIYIALIVARTVLLGQDNAPSGAPVFPYFGNALLNMLLLGLRGFAIFGDSGWLVSLCLWRHQRDLGGYASSHDR